ncbi:MAG: molybdenum cofactor biosynthesis protein MoaE [Dehalococcoidia bacterium]|nr:MAG: molybdenum cofactor biosynthesis protein MoaE [Dehalococcoidia bacterium]UCG84498.1 MAG: molybdenum cofactor biosynthesis protein MoaE [Dehalococcoidia bacterium]
MDDLIQITDEPIIPEDFVSSIEWDEYGALVTFTGKVRGRSDGKRVVSLEHAVNAEDAESMLRGIIRQMREQWDLGPTAFCYRMGPVEAGGVTLVIAVAATHRPEAFAACQYAIDMFKQRVQAKELREDD